MGVVSVSKVFSSEYWTGEKPAEYKGTELDKALQAWSALANKTVSIPKDLIPPQPKCKVGELGSYVDSLKEVVKKLDKYKEEVNKYISALNAVQAAGGKASSELTTISKGKNPQGQPLDEATKEKYIRAASAASSIASAAASELKKYQ